MSIVKIYRTNNKKAIFLCVFLLVANFTNLFASSLDSLENELSRAQGEERLVLLNQLSLDLRRVDIKKAEKMALEGIDLAGILMDSSSMYNLNLTLASILKAQSRFKEGINRVNTSLNYFKKKDKKEKQGEPT